MGNSNSKPGTCNSSTTVLMSQHTPSTSLPNSSGGCNTPDSSRRGRWSHSPGLTISPSTLPTFTFPERVDVETKELLDTTYASDSFPASSGVNIQPIAPSNEDSFAVINDISRPSPARPHVRHLSELIDPTLLAEHERYVRSPSGNLLTKRSFEERNDRPLSIRERQEKIQQKVKLQRSQLVLRDDFLTAGIQEKEPEKATTAKKGSRSSCFSCFSCSS